GGALDLQEPAIAPVAHQGLVPPVQLLAQPGHDRFAVGSVFFHLILIDAHHVAPLLDPHLLHLQRRRVLGSGAPGMDHAKAAAIVQDLLPDLLAAPHAGAEDVGPTLLVQVVNGLLADHAPVGDDADLGDAETPIQAIDDRYQRLDIGGVARPHLAADRPAGAVEHGADDHLIQIG